MVTGPGDAVVRGDAQPSSRHVGLVGGVGIGAGVIYYRAIAAGCADRGLVPRITIVHAHVPTVLDHAAAGRLDELADYLAGFAAELRDVGAEFVAIPAVTPHVALAPLKQRLALPIVDMLEVSAAGLHERDVSRIALFGTRLTIESKMFGALSAFDVVVPEPREIEEIDTVYRELALAGRASAPSAQSLRDIAHAITRRERVDAVVLAGTDLRLVFDETTTDFPAFDCAAVHIRAIVDRATAI